MVILNRDRLLTVLSQSYQLMLGAYPLTFREQYSQEMALYFRDSCRDIYERQGVRGLLWLMFHTLGDLIVSACRERYRHWRCLTGGERESYIMNNQFAAEHPFGERVTQVLEEEPAYYPLLVSMQPSRMVAEVAESIALDGDPTDPQTALLLFQELAQENPDGPVADWLATLCDAARRIYSSERPNRSMEITERYLYQLYANPKLFELIAAEEVGYRLLNIVECLALEGTVDEVDEMMELMQKLAAK